MNTKTGKIANIGPIAGPIEIPIPDKGGIVVLRGRNGAGKSIALSAIDSAITGKGKPPVRDKQLRGEVEFAGVTMTIGRSAQRIGTAEVFSIEGKLSIAELVDPGKKDVEVADAVRIRALISLTGAKADPALFHELVKDIGEFDKLVKPETLTTKDILTMTSRVKADLEENARLVEAEAENANSRSEAIRKAADGISLEGETDPKKLQKAFEKAVQNKSKLEEQNKAAKADARKRMAAEQSLQEAMDGYDGKSLEEASEEVEKTTAALEAAKAGLEAAQKQFNKASYEKKAADSEAKRAQDYHNLTTEWRATINAKTLSPVSDDVVTEAINAVNAARVALVNGDSILKAKNQLAEADGLKHKAKELENQALLLRAAARGTESVLSGLVAKSGVPLKVEPVNNCMRLTTETVRGESTPYGDLSDGERWRIAIDIAIKAVGKGGEITIPQAAWEALDPTNRLTIAEQLEEGGVLAYTAEAADGELRAEVFSANHN